MDRGECQRAAVLPARVKGPPRATVPRRGHLSCVPFWQLVSSRCGGGGGPQDRRGMALRSLVSFAVSVGRWFKGRAKTRSEREPPAWIALDLSSRPYRARIALRAQEMSRFHAGALTIAVSLSCSTTAPGLQDRTRSGVAGMLHCPYAEPTSCRRGGPDCWRLFQPLLLSDVVKTLLAFDVVTSCVTSRITSDTFGWMHRRDMIHERHGVTTVTEGCQRASA